MKNRYVLSGIFIPLVICSCSGKQTSNQANAATGANERLVAGFSFDTNQHLLTYQDAYQHVDNYCNFIRYRDAQQQPIPVRKADIRFITTSAFKSAFPKDSEQQRSGIRITMGLNRAESRLEYYFSPVLFHADFQREASDDALGFEPVDTGSQNNDFDFLRNVPVYHLTEEGNFSRLAYNSQGWNTMKRQWSDYKSSVSFINPVTQDTSAFNPAINTRSIIIPTQVIYNMIESESLEEFRIASCVHIIENNTQHSVLFSGKLANIEQVNQLISKGTVDELLEQFNSGCERRTPLLIRKIMKFSDLSIEELAYIDLVINKNSNAAYGMAANYTQLCPTKCSRLLGQLDPLKRIFRLIGMNK